MRERHLLESMRGRPSPVDMVCLDLGDFRWHSCMEMATRLLLPMEFINDVCLFLGRYGFADLKGGKVKLYPDQPSVSEAAEILTTLANGSTILVDHLVD